MIRRTMTILACAFAVMGMGAQSGWAQGPVSSGERFGDPGFYFLLRDRRGRHWAQYIRSFRERIAVYVDAEGVVRADHELSLWRRTALRLHYRINPRRSAETHAREPVAQPAIT